MLLVKVSFGQLKSKMEVRDEGGGVVFKEVKNQLKG